MILQRIWEELTAIHQLLAQNSKKLEKLMALADDLKTAIAKLDTETTQIGVVINALVAKLQAGNLSAQEQADIFAALKATSDHLTALGVDPTNPVPPPTPAFAKAKTLAKV